jgi:hypothetical protein
LKIHEVGGAARSATHNHLCSASGRQKRTIKTSPQSPSRAAMGNDYNLMQSADWGRIEDSFRGRGESYLGGQELHKQRGGPRSTLLEISRSAGKRSHYRVPHKRTIKSPS